MPVPLVCGVNLSHSPEGELTIIPFARGRIIIIKLETYTIRCKYGSILCIYVSFGRALYIVLYFCMRDRYIVHLKLSAIKRKTPHFLKYRCT